MSAGGDAAPAPRSNAASGVTDPAPPREPGVATAEPKPPAVAPKVAAPAPAAGRHAGRARPGRREYARSGRRHRPRRAEPRRGGRGRGLTGAGGARSRPAPLRPLPPRPPRRSRLPAAPAKPAPAVDEGRRSFMRLALPVGWVGVLRRLRVEPRGHRPLPVPERPLRAAPDVQGRPRAVQRRRGRRALEGQVRRWIVRDATGSTRSSPIAPTWLHPELAPRENKFKCPCHGSGYYKTGVNFEGRRRGRSSGEDHDRRRRPDRGRQDREVPRGEGRLDQARSFLKV